MSDVILMPMMTVPQEQAWLTLLDLHDQVPGHWTLVGGQMVHLWCAERSKSIARPTDDADAVLDVRLKPRILWDFTAALKEHGFQPVTASSGVQHRWTNGDAVIDVLIARHLGPRGANRKGAGGGRTIETPGAQKVLNRTELVLVQIGERVGTTPRPSLLGAIVAKSAAFTVLLDKNRDRHLGDLAVLASMLVPGDVNDHPPLDKRELRLVSNAVGHARAKPGAWSYVDGGAAGLERLARVLEETRHQRELRGKKPANEASAEPARWANANIRGTTTVKSGRVPLAPHKSSDPEITIG